MTRVLVTSRIAHDAYVPGETYLVEPDRAQRLARANLVHAAVISVEKRPRGTRKARPGSAGKDDQGGVAPGAGGDVSPGGEPGEGFGSGGYGSAEG